MSLKIDLLRTFATVAEAGNIGDAARQLKRTPAAVSMSLKQLEKALGGALFAAERKSQLTELGRFTQEVAINQIDGYERAIASVRAFARNETGHVSLACIDSQLAGLLPVIIRRYQTERPDATLELTWEASDQIADKVADQAVDLGLGTEPRPASGLLFEPLLADPFQVWFSAGSSLCRITRALNWRDLRQLKLVRNPVSDDLRNEAYRNLAARSSLRIEDPACVAGLIDSGDQVAIMPLLSVLANTPGIRHLPLNDHRARRQLGLIRRPNTPAPPGVEIISDMIREAVQNVAVAGDVTGQN